MTPPSLEPKALPKFDTISIGYFKHYWMSQHAQNHTRAKFVLIEVNNLPSLTLAIFKVNASKNVQYLNVRHLCAK